MQSVNALLDQRFVLQQQTSAVCVCCGREVVMLVCLHVHRAIELQEHCNSYCIIHLLLAYCYSGELLNAGLSRRRRDNTWCLINFAFLTAVTARFGG
jgi:hypothetical protein